MKISGHLVDIHKREIYPAEVSVEEGKIAGIKRTEAAEGVYIIPGLIDSHVHIESSMISPAAFGHAAVRHGTTGVVADPHEIANVLGKQGVEYMIEDSKRTPVKFWFGAPSCVPATDYETSGAKLTPDEVGELLARPDIKYLSEMMNYPGVIYRDKEVMKKLEIAERLGKPVDGHAPGLTGEQLRKYAGAGITTDHECSSIDEAREKISLGMKILIREGSAARNLNALKKLYRESPAELMLCSDDLHPEMLGKRHINKLVSDLISQGYDVFDVIRSATANPVIHYRLDAGLLQEGQKADFIIVGNPELMDIKETWIDGNKVYSDGEVNFGFEPAPPVNKFNCSPILPGEITLRPAGGKIRIIQAFDGEIITRAVTADVNRGAEMIADTENDLLKIVVKDRYKDSAPVAGIIRGFGLKKGAFASSVAHDSHNIVCIGADDNDIATAVNEIISCHGGLAVTAGGETVSLKLPIGGIMSDRSCDEVAREYLALNEKVKSLGCAMTAPFMTLSFMALLVIPELKIGDRGLFDVTRFRLVDLTVDEEND